MKRLLLIPLALLATHLANAQPQTWSAAVDSASAKLNRGDYPAVISLYHATSFPCQTTADSLQAAAFCHLAGDAWYYLADYKASIGAYQRGILHCPATDAGRNEKARLFYDQAFSEHEFGWHVASNRSSVKAARLMENVVQPDPDYLISIYVNLAYNYRDLGFFDLSAYYLERGEQAYQNHREELDAQESDNAAKVVLLTYNRLLQAVGENDENALLRELHQMDSLYTARTFNAVEESMYRSAMNEAADFYLNQFESFEASYAVQKAFGFLEQSVAGLPADESSDACVQYRFNKTKVYYLLGDLATALKDNRELLETTAADDFRQPFFQAQRGLILLKQKKLEPALTAFAKMAQYVHQGADSLAADGSNFEPGFEVNHAMLMADIARELEAAYPDLENVRKQLALYYRLALAQFENSFDNRQFNHQLRTAYDKILTGLLRISAADPSKGEISPKRLVATMENIENRMAWQSFRYRRASMNFKGDSLLQREQELIQRKKQLRLQNQSAGLVAVDEELKRLESAIKQQYPGHQLLSNPQFDISEWQMNLSPNQVVIRFASAGDELYRFTLTRDAAQLELIGQSTHVLPLVNEYLNTIEGRGSDQALASRIADLLLPSDLTAFEHVIVIPNPSLSNLPFEALVRNGRYLVEDFAVSYAPYLVFTYPLSTTNPRSVDELQLAHFAPDYTAHHDSVMALVGAEQELTFLSEVFPTNSYTDVTSGTFATSSQSADVIHLSMHAMVPPDAPAASYLLFANEDQLDRLYLDELYNLRLDANLVFLGACHTGVSFPNEKNDLTAMHRAFTHSGVSSTIAGLWSLPDQSTAQLTASFYQALKGGRTKAQALSDAKRDYLINTPDEALKAPYYWAGLVLNGESGALVAPTEESGAKVWWIVGTMLLVVLSFWGWKRRRAH